MGGEITQDLVEGPGPPMPRARHQEAQGGRLEGTKTLMLGVRYRGPQGRDLKGTKTPMLGVQYREGPQPMMKILKTVCDIMEYT